IALKLHHHLHDAVHTLRPHGRLLIIVPPTSEILVHAVHGFVRSLAREVGCRGITVNALLSPDLPTAAPLVAFFASDRASFVTGQSLRAQAGAPFAEPEVKPSVAVVTGGAQGIGAACATYLAAAGHRVAVLDLPTQQDAGTRLCDRLGGEAAGMAFVPCNVLDAQAVDAALERARLLSPCGTVDVLVNNAGITRDRTFCRMSIDEWEAVLHVNLKAVIDVTRRARQQLARGARIVNVASLTGLAGNFGQTNYATARGGVVGFTRQAARELEPMGICVTAVAPGLIDTSMSAKIPRIHREVAKQMTSLAQIGTPADVAAAVEFLARREAWPLRGQVVRVDGGLFFGA
ncbi:MAG: SDR family oxidoreductase, partial [Polyangiaceae bacterium]|nr:SDR family oxidoreductase [Polyangiaceae bacterium]